MRNGQCQQRPTLKIDKNYLSFTLQIGCIKINFDTAYFINTKQQIAKLQNYKVYKVRKFANSQKIFYRYTRRTKPLHSTKFWNKNRYYK